MPEQVVPPASFAPFRSAQAINQFVFGDVVPEADAVEDVVQGAFRKHLVIRHRYFVHADRRFFAKADVASPLAHGFIAQRVELSDELPAANLWKPGHF